MSDELKSAEEINKVCENFHQEARLKLNIHPSSCCFNIKIFEERRIMPQPIPDDSKVVTDGNFANKNDTVVLKTD